MKLIGFQVYPFDFFVRYLPACRVFPAVQTAGHLETFGGCRTRYQIDDCLVIPKRLATPVGGDERKQSVFNLVPLAGARREVTYGDGKIGFIG